MVALPGQLFYGTQIPACLWFLARDKSGKPTKGGKRLRDRRGPASASATLEEIRGHAHVLTPGRYVGAAYAEDDGESFEEVMARLVAELREQRAEAARLDAEIAANLAALGWPLSDTPPSETLR